MAELLFGTHTFDTDLIIFDKDGTLIDFAELWAYYTIGAVEALMASTEEVALMASTEEAALMASTERKSPSVAQSGKLRIDLYAMLGYDPATRRFDTQSPVVTAPLPTLCILAAGVLYRHGWGWLDAELQVERTFAPKLNEALPLELVRPTAPLPALFGALRQAGVQIAVVTSDDRAPTLATLGWLELIEQIAFVACADDGYPYKPAPEAVWAACAATGVDRARTVMVGDSTTDMLMAQRAGVGLRVAVLTGMMDAGILAPHADVVLNSVGEIQVGR